MEPQRHAAFFDVHAPLNIDFEPVLKFVQSYRPTHLIIGGDFLNCQFASHWNENVFKEIGYSKLAELLEGEINAGKKLLKEIRSALPDNCEMIYIPGNHENWLYWVALYHPQIGAVNGILPHLKVDKLHFKSDLAQLGNNALATILKTALEADKIKMKVLPFNQILTIGHLNYVHGHQFNNPGASLRKYPDRNIIYGHHHTHDVKTLHNAGDNNRCVQHVGVPCMTHLGPGYLRDNSTRWLQGFFIADVLSNGLFDGRVKKIVNRKLIPEI